MGAGQLIYSFLLDRCLCLLFRLLQIKFYTTVDLVAQICLLMFSFGYSKFSDIYDEEHFVKRLQNDVRVVDKVPDFIMERFGHNLSNVFNFKIKAWSSSKYYKDVVLPKLVEER